MNFLSAVLPNGASEEASAMIRDWRVALRHLGIHRRPAALLSPRKRQRGERREEKNK